MTLAHALIPGRADMGLTMEAVVTRPFRHG
jgi:hypothetical protein